MTRFCVVYVCALQNYKLFLNILFFILCMIVIWLNFRILAGDMYLELYNELYSVRRGFLKINFTTLFWIILFCILGRQPILEYKFVHQKLHALHLFPLKVGSCYVDKSHHTHFSEQQFKSKIPEKESNIFSYARPYTANNIVSTLLSYDSLQLIRYTKWQSGGVS